jgi:hypothetical protein
MCLLLNEKNGRIRDVEMVLIKIWLLSPKEWVFCAGRRERQMVSAFGSGLGRCYAVHCRKHSSVAATIRSKEYDHAISPPTAQQNRQHAASHDRPRALSRASFRARSASNYRISESEFAIRTSLRFAGGSAARASVMRPACTSLRHSNLRISMEAGRPHLVGGRPTDGIKSALARQ